MEYIKEVKQMDQLSKKIMDAFERSGTPLKKVFEDERQVRAWGQA